MGVFLLVGCVRGEETSDRRIEIAHLDGRSTPIVCAESRHGDAPAGWPSPDPDILGPPPFSLLREGPFLICRAYQAGAVSASDYRTAGFDQPDTLVHAWATVGLLQIGARDPETVMELRSWHLNSRFLRVVCRAAFSRLEKIDADSEKYCTELTRNGGHFIVMR